MKCMMNQIAECVADLPSEVVASVRGDRDKCCHQTSLRSAIANDSAVSPGDGRGGLITAAAAEIQYINFGHLLHCQQFKYCFPAKSFVLNTYRRYFQPGNTHGNVFFTQSAETEIIIQRSLLAIAMSNELNARVRTHLEHQITSEMIKKFFIFHDTQ